MGRLVLRALGHALLNDEEDSLRQAGLELLEILSGNGIAKRVDDDLVLQGEGRGDDALEAGVIGDEGGDGESGRAVRVELGVEGTLGEDGHLAGIQREPDGAIAAVVVGAGLENRLGDDGALGDNEELCGARVDVDNAHAACFDSEEELVGAMGKKRGIAEIASQAKETYREEEHRPWRRRCRSREGRSGGWQREP